MATRIVTVTELKTQFRSLLAELERDGVPLYVTQYGKPRAVVVAYGD